MKRVVFISAMLVFVFAATPVLADFYTGTGNLNQTGTVGTINYSSGNGGEFTISNSSLSISGYVAGVTSEIKGYASSFQTFCLEKSEYTASLIDIWVSTTSIDELTGVVGSPGSGSHAVYGSKKYGDNLDPMTAYLYTQFATGALTDYDYSNTGAGRNISAGQLQKAIWFLEEEGVSLVAGSQADKWVIEAQSAGWTDIGNVRVLNNWTPGYKDDPRYRKQDQLYITPIPASVILGLIGISIVGVKLRKYA
ncbi:MAG: hypothetical protein GY845_12340 [Planctomycetes bacterium]|nr:hypothetical protein [Planctomycetota bacterium]